MPEFEIKDCGDGVWHVIGEKKHLKEAIRELRTRFPPKLFYMFLCFPIVFRTDESPSREYRVIIVQPKES